jgi:hypothetical protein
VAGQQVGHGLFDLSRLPQRAAAFSNGRQPGRQVFAHPEEARRLPRAQEILHHAEIARAFMDERFQAPALRVCAVQAGPANSVLRNNGDFRLLAGCRRPTLTAHKNKHHD